MTEDHRKVSEQLAQGILLDDPGFLREIVERVLQQMLEAEMTHHIGAAPYERSDKRTGHRDGGPSQAQGARRRPTRSVRGAKQGSGA